MSESGTINVTTLFDRKDAIALCKYYAIDIRKSNKTKMCQSDKNFGFLLHKNKRKPINKVVKTKLFMI